MGHISNKDIEYRNYMLGDVKVIELLLSLRYKYDDYLYMRGNSTLMIVGGVEPMNEEVITTYLVLDGLIKSCNLSDIQLQMLEMIQHGYSGEEIAFELDIPYTRVTSRLETIYKAIKKENDRQWRKNMYINTLGLKGKTCSKCKEYLPATPEFYSDLNRTKDGFHSQCRKCKK